MHLARDFHFSDNVVVVLRAADGVIVDVNPAFERRTGFSRAEAVGKQPLELGLWRDAEARAAIWGRLHAERSITAFPVEFRVRTGEFRRGRISCEFFEHEGAALVLALVQDSDVVPFIEPGEPVESYRSLFAAATEGIYRSVPGGGFIDVNPAMARIFGYDSPEQMLAEHSSRAMDAYVAPDHAAWLHAQLEEKGRVEGVRAQIRRRDGQVIWTSENCRAVRDAEGRVLFYEGTLIDITEELAAEAALRQSEALYKVLVENCRDGVYLIQRGRILFANPALATMLGYTSDQLAGTAYMDLVAPEDREAQLSRRQARESGNLSTQRYEIHLMRRDGTRALFEVLADGIVYQGDVASTGVMRDVTEERARQRALEDAERKYRELFERSPVGLFRARDDGSGYDVNGAFARMLGYESVAALKQRHALLFEVLTSEAYAALCMRLRDFDRIDSLQVQALRADGSCCQLEVSVERHVEDGEERLDGTAQDIGERLETGRRLAASEARYRNLVEHSQVGVYLMREDRYTYVNAAFAKMVGYSEGELIGLHWRSLCTPESEALIDDRVRRRERGESLSPDYEITLARKDGGIVHVTVSAGVMKVGDDVLVGGTMRDITRHRQAERRLRFHATHDSLTGLPNRLLFQQHLDERLREARRLQRDDYAVLFIDLDGFKLVNDSLGHAAGDRLLVAIAERLAETVGPETLIARYGGDEFTLMPHGSCSRERAELLAERLLGLFADPFEIGGGNRVFSGASVGIVLGRQDYVSPDHVLRDADTAMYRAKAAGKLDYVVFDEAMHRAARARLEIETALRMALTRGEFRVHFQPLVLLRDGSVTGCEALVRWQHPDRGLILPGEFLAVAEEAGLTPEIDWWVLEQACAHVARWRTLPGHASLKVNVNVDERQIGDADLVPRLESILRRTGLPAVALSLEVTETVFRTGRARAARTLGKLKDIGVGLVVDDFGTGYSSLDSFAASPFDALKIDRSFVHDMTTNRRHRAIVRTITRFAEDLGLTLTAEGVEESAQALALLEMGCEHGQGYLYAHPMSADQFEAHLRLLQASAVA